MELIWITKAKYINQYKIEIEFNTKENGIVNFEKQLENGIFNQLQDLDTFKNFKLNTWTLEWQNGADFEPEFIYRLLKSGQK